MKYHVTFHVTFHVIFHVILQAIRRMVERNGFSQAEAEKRIDSQISNVKRIEKSNVAICTLWEYEITRRQVSRFDFILDFVEQL